MMKYNEDVIGMFWFMAIVAVIGGCFIFACVKDKEDADRQAEAERKAAEEREVMKVQTMMLIP